MEKAILKTLIYADIFEYPLLAYEVHKWLIAEKASLKQVEKSLQRLIKKNKIKKQKDYYFLPDRASLVKKRLIRKSKSSRFFLKAKILTWFLKIVPTIKLVGISGGLAMENAAKEDDIDLFIITSKNRLWLSRLFTAGILDFMGARRKAKMDKDQAAGKLCVNILLSEDKLEQSFKDLFVAHEVLQMKVLWQRDHTYKKYLEDNIWVFKFLPNWVGEEVKDSKFKIENLNSSQTMDFLEKLARWLQLKIMKKAQGKERVEEGALYFHPNDIRQEILLEYRKRVQ